MRKYREIIRTATGIELSDEIEDSDNDDPFLCKKCQSYGYCIEKFYKNPSNNELIPIEAGVVNRKTLTQLNQNTFITDKEIANWVPLRTEIKDASTPFGKKLQKAHDLFHQEEYEQASYMYRDMLETRNDCDEIRLGLVSSLYFLENYHEAADIALRINSPYKKNESVQFIRQCEKKINEKRDYKDKKVKTMVFTSMENNSIVVI
jgi:hypothetical protein